MAILFLITSGLLAGCQDQSSVPLQEQATQETLSELNTGSRDAQKVADWPRMFGPDGNSRSPEEWVNVLWPAAGPKLLWEIKIGRGYSQPVIARGKLILLHRLDDWELATCYDSERGQLLWETAWPASYRNLYEYSDGTYTTPVIDDDRIYVLGATCQLLCLSLDDGSRIWTRDMEQDYDPEELPYGFGATPLLEDDRLIINLGGQRGPSGIIAVDKMTGDTLWTATEELASYCTPVATTVGDQRFVLVLTKMNLVCLDPATGEVFWKEEFGIRNSRERINAVSPLLVGKDRVLITFGPGPGARLFQLSADGSHETVWSTRRGGLESQYTNLLLQDDRVLAFSPLTSCELRCIDLENGEVLWAWHREHTLRRSMSIQVGEKYVIALSQEGQLFSLAPSREGPRLISWVEEPVLEPNCFTQPVLSHGLLYVRNEKFLKCFSLRAGSLPEDLLTASDRP
ncbi:MAG: PQQ-like beta-propeller repeat protein [Planctomycetaceae bacterium]|nr:PQQ-like beta-propeller repeat protein [Planctomycetaceae bacterium]